MEFKENLQTKNVGFGKNTCEFIILHHTGTPPGTTKGNLNVLLGNTTRKVSAHYLVSDNGDIYKLAKDYDITFHAGTSNWKGKTDLNRYAIGIEVVGPGFTEAQKEKVGELIVYLSEKYNISQENIIRHKDVTSRKVDIDDSFWNNRFPSWADYVKSLFTKKGIMGEFAKLEGFELSTSSEKDYETPATVGDVKDLLEVLIYRYHTKKENGTLKIRNPKNGNTQSQAKK